MKFTMEDKLISIDFSFNYYSSLAKVTEERIKEDTELMAEILEVSKEAKKEYDENLKEGEAPRLTLQDYIDLKIDDLAIKAVDQIRLYVEFDVEVNL